MDINEFRKRLCKLDKNGRADVARDIFDKIIRNLAVDTKDKNIMFGVPSCVVANVIAIDEYFTTEEHALLAHIISDKLMDREHAIKFVETYLNPDMLQNVKKLCDMRSALKYNLACLALAVASIDDISTDEIQLVQYLLG